MTPLKKGFTLIEVLMAVGILGIVSLVVVAFLGSTRSTWAEGSGQVVLSSQLRQAMDRISRELVQCPVGQIDQPDADGQWSDTVVFRIPEDQDGDGSVLDENGNIVEWSNWIRYLLNGEENRLERRMTTGIPDPLFLTQTMASRMTGLEFRRQGGTPDVVEIRLTAAATLENGRTISRTTEGRVYLRNEQAGGVIEEGEGPPEGFS